MARKWLEERKERNAISTGWNDVDDDHSKIRRNLPTNSSNFSSLSHTILARIMLCRENLPYKKFAG
ncbi:uncharacterized protein CELE_F23H12.10 [Caenorhabditis elegans]|uniref:Uncharacterized protein n=1 Tax=Caenorhabditis elegans TaxID=6239 RepID=A0A1E1JKL0_CAEEL|nr:Uncharacterized protein CELE_F23H12.10 [Caenorhabditis elegans]CEO42635.2 Uncharacterized protein CELE_F23H12.10 [Caenorhabditis elegans]|eukprot:NP_001334201.1 Uncharacterized protein CELE_F23H12.10 [Caenorhabditis elegans]